MLASIKTKFFAFCLIPIVSSLAACKPATESQSATSAQRNDNEQAQKTNDAQATQSAPSSRTLSAEQWLTKKNLSAEEERTVDALIESINTLYSESRSNRNASNLARWAMRKLDHVDLSGKNLTNISPILAFKNISTLHLLDNKFTQPQIDELLKGLPKLKTLVTDEGLNCSANVKVTCLK